MHNTSPTQEQMTNMLKLQASMNEKVNPNWLAANYPFLRAVLIEGSEAVEHHGWKWWKRQERDLPQLQMELVDIWHFMLSQVIINNSGSIEAAEKEIRTELASNEGTVVFDGAAYPIQELDTVRKLELMIGLAAARRMSLALFSALLTDCEMDWEILLKQYVGKNVLNFFRQDYGYKQGTYLKVWAGREDNEHLAEILAEVDASEESVAMTVYSMLQARYIAHNQ
jgi:dimeric dUTPase (all-alpha-NTP-PPase superfamily)